MNAIDPNHTVRFLCHVVYFFSKLLKDIQDYCFFNMSDPLVVGIAFGRF